MSLTLQMTAGNDNAAVWVLRIHGEGVNQLSNGSFDSDTVWGKTGDWAIGSGVANYTYSASATGQLSQTITAVAATAYVLEYEVTEVSNIAYTFSLDNGGSGVVSATTYLPTTLGKHRVNVYGNSGATTFALRVNNAAATDVLKIDNVKFRKAENTTYLATKDLTLDNTYDGKVLEFSNRISDISQFMDAQSSGSIAGVSSYQFIIARYSGNTNYDGFINEFYPDKDGGFLIAREVDIGLVWDTATTDTEITWLMKGKITDYSFGQRSLIVIVTQSTDTDQRPIPHYVIQKDITNNISYFASAPDENYGATIPIVYGARDNYNFVAGAYGFSPCLITDTELNQVILASHQLYSITASPQTLSRFISSINSYMFLSSADDGGGGNNPQRSRYNLTDTKQTIIGAMAILLQDQSAISNVSNLYNVIDRDSANYYELNSAGDGANTLALRVGGSGSTGEVGWLGVGANDIIFRAVVSSDEEASGDGGRDYTLNYDNRVLVTPPNIGTPATGTLNDSQTPETRSLAFGNSTVSKGDIVLPWTIEEICGLDYFITNDDVTAGSDKIRVYYMYIELQNIIISGIVRQYNSGSFRIPLFGRRVTFFGPRGSQYESSSGRGFSRRLHFSHGEEKKNEVSGLFARIKGRKFGRWIDNSGGVRSNGYNEGDLIEQPAYIIESLYRDEVYVERDLQSTTATPNTIFTCTDLQVREDDYYNNAEIYDASISIKDYITDYTGSTATLTMSTGNPAISTGDHIFLTNIQGDNKIDISSFDAVGNTTNGSRDGWLFANTINSKTSIEDLVNELCFESHCTVIETVNEDMAYPNIKIIALDVASSGDTWTKPVFNRGIEQVKTSLSPLYNVFTSYKLLYYYDSGRQDYVKEISVDKNSFGGAGTLGIEEQNLCKLAEQQYQIINPFSYSANWIYDDTTAELFLQKKIEWFTKQRLIVEWVSGLSDGSIDYIKYELGDQVKLNYTKAIPAGLNNSSYFMITSKRIITVQGAPAIQWTLLEMG